MQDFLSNKGIEIFPFHSQTSMIPFLVIVFFLLILWFVPTNNTISFIICFNIFYCIFHKAIQNYLDKRQAFIYPCSIFFYFSTQCWLSKPSRIRCRSFQRVYTNLSSFLIIVDKLAMIQIMRKSNSNLFANLHFCSGSSTISKKQVILHCFFCFCYLYNNFLHMFMHKS